MEVNITQEQDSAIPISISKQVFTQEKLKDAQSHADSRKNNSRARPFTRTLLVKDNIETYSLDESGTIEKARKHRDANRPLHVIGEINNNVNFCHCCDLPCEEKGIIVPFKVCDHSDTFAECGLGISLYFLFFKFVILISLLAALSLSLVLMILNINYSAAIKDVCNSKYKNVNDSKIGNCYGYVSEAKSDENYYNMFNQWLQRLSSDFVFIYRKLPQQLSGKNNDNIDDVLVNYSLVDFIFLVTTFLLSILFLFLIRAEIKKLKINNITIRDYTVLISGAKNILTDYIDSKNHVKFIKRESQIAVENFQDFKIYVNDYIKDDKKLYNITIAQVNICYRLGDYLVLMNNFEEIKRKIFQINHNPHTKEKNMSRKYFDDNRRYYNYPLSILGIYCCAFEQKTLGELKAEKDVLDARLSTEENRVRGKVEEKYFTNYMLISFNKIDEKEKFLRHYPHDFCSHISFFFLNIEYYLFPCCVDKTKKEKFWRSKGINAKDPPEPEDIFWENFQYSFVERLQRTVITYIICILIIALSFGVIFGLTLLQEHLYSDDKENGDTNIFLKYLTSLGITIVISIINSLIQLALEKLTFEEKPKSKSNYILSLSIKITIFTFLNSAIIPLICKYVVAIKQKDDKDDFVDYYVSRVRDNLLIDDMFIYFIVNGIITPLLWILNFPYWFKKLRICCIERKKDPNLHHHMTQKELNELYEYPDMNLAYKLSYLVKTLSMCLFYMPIFPLGCIIVFLGFIFAYWVEKYVFTHQCKRPDMLDEIIEKYYANYFIVVLFIGSIGDYIFLHNAFHTNSWTLINIIVFGVLIIVPYTKCINCNYVDSQSNGIRERPLSDVYFTFYNDYQRQNPLTKKLGLENYLTELKKKGYLSDNAFNIAMENIEKLNLMEMYYGISKNNMPLVHQSILDNVKSESIISVNNLRGTFLGAGAIKSTIIRPQLEDSVQAKKIKREFFESQIMNLFGKEMANRGLKNLNENIQEDERNIIESKINLDEKLNEMNVPISQSVYKDKNQNDNLN